MNEADLFWVGGYEDICPFAQVLWCPGGALVDRLSGVSRQRQRLIPVSLPFLDTCGKRGRE